MLGQSSLKIGMDLSDPMMARSLGEQIRRFGFEQNRAGRWDVRDLAFALADVAKAVGNLEPALGWDPDACTAIAKFAAAAMTAIATTSRHEVAVSLARTAVASAAEI